MALLIAFTSIHMAAAARVASLRRQQEKFEQFVAGAQPGPAGQSAAAGTVPTAVPAAIAGVTQPSSLAATDLKAKLPAAMNGQPSPAFTSQAPTVSQSRKRQIIISIADRKLALIEDGQVLKVYSTAVGTRRTPSPEGDFVIVNHAKDPTYRHGDKEIAPGKDNPLGTRWMGLSLKGYGIHGTNVQSSVGKAASHGCFRMRKQDVEELYTLVRVGDTVTIRRERDSQLAQLFDAPSTPAVAMTMKPASSVEVQVASSAVATVETAQE